MTKNDYNPLHFLSDKATTATKLHNNAEWVAIRAEWLDTSYGDTLGKEYLEIVEDNYNLMQGEKMLHYKKRNALRDKNLELELRKEGLDMPSLEIEHFDYLSYMIDGLVGDQQKRRLNYIVTDQSMYTRNYIKDQEDALLTDFIKTNFIEPAKMRALQAWQMEHGVSDIFSLQPQEREQMQSDVAQKVDQLTPLDIRNFLKHGAKGRAEKQGQALADYYAETCTREGLKFLADEAYKHSFATDAMIFYQGIRRNKPFCEMVDLTSFNTGGSASLFIDDNDWFKRVRYMSGISAWNEFSHGFTQTDSKNFGDLITLGGGRHEGTPNKQKDINFVLNIDDKGLVELANTNLLTQRGQAQYTELLGKYEGFTRQDSVRVVNLVFSTLRKMRQIKRAYPDGTIRFDWHAETYQFDPVNGDLSQQIHWVKEYWMADKIGTGEKAVYANKGPVPVQFRDITDPYSTRSPYTGGFFNDLLGHGKRRSRLHRIKPIVHNINFVMKTIKDREATDIGKVMLMTLAAKPKGWTWGKFLMVIRTIKLLPVETKLGGLTAADVQFFRELDLGNAYELLPRVNYMHSLIDQMATILSYNSARAGTPAASTSVTNNMTNLNRSLTQTHNYTVWYDKIIERVIQNGIYLTKKCAKDGNLFVRRVLDDLSIVNIDIDVDEFDEWLLNVQVVTDELDNSKIDLARNILQPFIQNSGISLGAAVQSIFAKTRGDFDSIITEVEMQNEVNRARMADVQMKTQADAIQLEKDIIVLKEEMKRMTDAQNNEVKLDMAAIGAMTLANANDINKDGQNDFVQKAEDDRKTKLEIAVMQDNTKREEIGLKNSRDKEKNDIIKRKPVGK